ncbi:hypothetical protein AN958_02818 [Leucoagaricus sp. SymC.cos]|nr:hypothetical protein AN958_02818 [Leucoagaricus sp. SymC.cos]
MLESPICRHHLWDANRSPIREANKLPIPTPPYHFIVFLHEGMFSDIWAFGCLLYLITCRRTPYYQHDTRRPGNLINAIVVKRELPLRPTIQDSNTDFIGDPFWDLITRCLNWDPASRPHSWTKNRGSIQHLLRSGRPEEMLSTSADFWSEMKRDSNVRISFDFQAVRDLLVKENSNSRT